MFRLIPAALSAWCIIGSSAYGAAPAKWLKALPAGARVVETKELASTHGPRLMVLWMDHVEEQGRDIADDEPYTCMDEIDGSRSWRGAVRLSLLKGGTTGEEINTVRIDEPASIPRRIRRGEYWSPSARHEGTPVIMRLHDYNGDGKPLEFALHSMETCSDHNATFLGYSERLDRAVRYPVDVEVIEGPERSRSSAFWVPARFLSTRRDADGIWRFEWRYAGDDREFAWSVRYDPTTERFLATETITSGP